MCPSIFFFCTLLSWYCCAAVMATFDPATLHRRHALPSDLQDVQHNFSKWVSLGKSLNALGILLLILLLKFPSARGAFVTEIDKRKDCQDTAYAVYQSLKETGLLLSGSAAYSREMDDIKAVGLAHGLAICGTRLGVWKPATDGKLRLHKSLYTILPYSDACRDQVMVFLNADLHSFLCNMDTATSIRTWQKTFELFRKNCKRAKVPLMSSSYNPAWIFRGYQVGAMHENINSCRQLGTSPRPALLFCIVLVRCFILLLQFLLPFIVASSFHI
jgi:hypothetical protein